MRHDKNAYLDYDLTQSTRYYAVCGELSCNVEIIYILINAVQSMLPKYKIIKLLIIQKLLYITQH